jgi:hypothetical protein
MRAEVRAENEILIKRVQLENQILSQEFSERLKSETSKLAQQVRQVQNDTERELVAVQKTLQGISSEFDTRLQQSHSHNEVTEEPSIKIVEVRSDVDLISGKVNNLTNGMETIKGDMLKICINGMER